MKYIVIFDEIPDKSSWFEADESWLKFQGVLINAVAESKKEQALQKELTKRIFKEDSGEQLFEMNSFDKPLVFNEPVTIIRCGFFL